MYRYSMCKMYTDTIFNGCLAILKNLKCLQLKKELKDKKDCVQIKMSHYTAVCSFRVIFSFDEKL